MDESQTIRVSVEEAAAMLGIEKASVKKRIQRGKLRSEQDATGTVYVYVDRSETVQDKSETVQDSEPGALTSELRDRLRYVEGQLEAERQAHAEARRIIAGLVERIPALEPPSEPRESPETPAEPRPSTTGAPEAETPAEARPWWRRVFST